MRPRFSFRGSESITLQNTNEKNKQKKHDNYVIPLATQAKYTLIDLSVQLVRSTVLQNIASSLNPFIQHNIATLLTRGSGWG